MIKLQIDQIYEELERFHAAADSFRPYSQDFISKTASRLEGFNSDFIDQMKKLLENMTDTASPRLMEKADVLYTAVKSAVDSFVEADKALAKKLDEQK